MPQGLARSLALFCTAFSLCSVASAQTPATTAPNPAAAAQGPQQPRGPRPAPVNLKVLPKSMTGDQVVKLMRQYQGELGVECEFCHAQNPATKRNDFPSDANPTKDVARYMIAMTADLNDKYLAEMPDRRYGDPITCGTCHRGQKHPSIFVPPPAPPRTPAAATAPPPPPSH